MIDFNDLKSRVRIEDVVAMLGLTGTRQGDSWRGKCPACNSGGDRALAVTPSRQSYYCFAQKKGGDLIALTSHVRGVGVKQAAEEIAGHFTAPQKPPQDAPQAAPAPRGGGFDPQKVLGELLYDHEAVQGLGLAADQAQ